MKDRAVTNPNDEALYADDPGHPLPQLHCLDMMGKRRIGGAELFMMVRGPLRGDARSQRRLLRKFDVYLGFIGSPDFAQECGAPDPATTRIVVRIDPASDPAIFDLLQRCEPWVRESRATLAVEAPSGAVQ
jgi:hypothetical protein